MRVLNLKVNLITAPRRTTEQGTRCEAQRENQDQDLHQPTAKSNRDNQNVCSKGTSYLTCGPDTGTGVTESMAEWYITNLKCRDSARVIRRSGLQREMTVGPRQGCATLNGFDWRGSLRAGFLFLRPHL
ncbi:hypothetical protein J6590_088265 [Homalodisca vitripennis]|nr:hypothetical protein J6590_088265 [Homalodisca vitripennis]